MKRIGIVGGLSPESTIEYYRFIIKGYREKTRDNGAPEIIIYSLNVKQSLEMMEKKQWVAYVQWVAGAVNHLADAGADFALIAANTPHMFFYEIKSASRIPLLSIVEETAEVLKVSPRTVKRDWTLARAWMLEAMRPGGRD